eukprot:934048-Amphidinium_carterae.1
MQLENTGSALAKPLVLRKNSNNMSHSPPAHGERETKEAASTPPCAYKPEMTCAIAWRMFWLVRWNMRSLTKILRQHGCERTVAAELESGLQK